MKKLLVCVGFVFAIAVLLSLGFFSQGPINRSSFERIKAGMSEAELEAILGGPSGNYSTRQVGFENVLATDKTKAWLGNFGLIVVDFDENGSVASKKFHEVHRMEETWYERILYFYKK